ncbi:hypothetical protein [Streptomyces zagrosensis]|uniref:Secreted protein n=1 Tax=Streptomyces zagrosensis TaxID=1042984 RepID=A0A7W9QBC8_9ACTN|nr:hypothetical protein [Streptomyces zagrosensis]MBB5936102.1 hypothetical protein [Streptomyces zagrosensis]
MIRVPRMVTATTAALMLVVGLPAMANASPRPAHTPPPSESIPSVPPGSSNEQLPAGWQVTGEGTARQLVWRSSDQVPMGDARVEFYAGDRLLGQPVPGKDGRTFRLALDGARLGPAKELQVRAGGRRLDAPDTARAPLAPRPNTPMQRATPPPANPVDPGKPGPYRTASGEYALKSVRLPDFPAPVEMRATVVGPTNAPGRRPLALFLHGRHYTCFGKGEETGDWPCAPGAKQVPSYRGYLKAQKLLASQGYVTVSISANGVNGQDYAAADGGAQARSSLIRQHLARWADWSAKPKGAPAPVRAVSRTDMSRVLLVGHSRGGEGVNRAALDSLSRPPAASDGYQGPVRWRIRGNVLIGPTIFGHNPVPDVPSTTILPGCDGDVSDLQGQTYVDGTRGVSRGAALHSAVYMVGANHNFFNAEWTPGQAQAPADDDFSPDDTPDRVCSPGTKSRLTATQQQTAGATYIAASAHLFVAGDDRVRPLLDGSNRRAPSAGAAQILTHAVGAKRTPAIVPDTSVTVTGGRLCSQVTPDPAASCLNGEKDGASPHFNHWETPREPGRYAVAMRWTKPGSAVQMRPARPFSVAGNEALALRVIVPPNTTGTPLDVALTDTSGRRVTLGRVTVDGLPGTDRTASSWGREVRVPLSAAAKAKLNLKQIKAVELTPRNRSGRAWLMDAWGWRPGTPAVRPAELLRMDIGRLTVKEGNSGTRTHHVPIRVTGHGSGQVRLFVEEPGADEPTSRLVTLRPGTDTVDVPVKVTGNTRYGAEVGHNVFVKAVRGAVIGSHHGGVLVQNDDPAPTITVTPVKDRVTEGQSLTWRVSLSDVADTELPVDLVILPVSGGTELSTLDVSARWLDDVFGESPAPARPLSKMYDEPGVPAGVPAGKKSVEVSVPTIKDKVAEPEEKLRLQMVTYDDDTWEPKPGPVFTGTVLDAS